MVRIGKMAGRWMAVLLAAALAWSAQEPVMAASESAAVSAREMENSQLSLEAATQGMVLLENRENALPIEKKGNIALFGGGAVKTVKGGTGSGDVNQRYTVSIWEGFKNAGYHVTSSDWLNKYEEAWEKGEAEFDGGFWDSFSMEEPKLTEEDIRFALQDGETDTAVYVISRISGEGNDRTNTEGDYLLSQTEKKNLKKVAAAFDHTIVVLNVGGVIDTSFFSEIKELDALLLMGQAGMEGGAALVQVLNGTVTPSGKLPDTWARNYSDYPSSAAFGANDQNVDEEEYTEGIYVGYRYFDTFDVTPAYPFGYGLSYTDFSVETQQVSADPHRVAVTVKVTNTGKAWPGREVIQIYFSAPDGEIEKPYQELAAYGKTDQLAPGESQTLTISFPTTEMASYSTEQSAYVLEAGDYVIRVGTSSRNTHAAAVIRLDGEAITEQLSSQVTLDKELKTLSARHTVSYHYEGELEEIQAAQVIFLTASQIPHEEHSSPYDDETVVSYVSHTTETGYLTENLSYTPSASYHGEYSEQVVYLEGDFSSCTLRDVYDGTITMEEFVSGLTVSELTDLVIGGNKLPDASGQSAGASSKNLANVSDKALALARENSVQGAAGETAGIYIDSKKIPNIIMADGPAGLRLTQAYELEDGKEYYQFCTGWPIGTSLAATWDTELMEQVGAALGKELAEYGVTILLAPGMNIHRNPLCGRNFEYYSEDPWLTGTMGAAETKGIQSNPGIGACIKHFAANSQEENRLAVNNRIDERTLREIYLKGFEIAVKEACPMAVMSSYNQNNQIPSGDNYDLLTDILRGEWGFSGLVMSDWGGGQSTPSISLHAGNDLIMPGSSAEDITVRGFGDEEPVFGEDGVYPAVTVDDNQFYPKVTTFWGEFVPDADGDTEIVRTVKTSVYEKAQRDSLSEDGSIVQRKVSELLEELGNCVSVLQSEDGTTTVTYRGYYQKNNITLGDLQKSAANILNVILASSQFADLFDDLTPQSYTELSGRELTEYMRCEKSAVY